MSATLWIAAPSAQDEPAGGAAPLLGLTLLRRQVLAGERAGFQNIFVETRLGRDDDSALAGTRALWVDPAGKPPDVSPGRIVLLSARTLPRVGWLRDLAAQPVAPGSLLVDSGAAAAADAAQPELSIADLNARANAGAIETLAGRFSAVAAPESPDRLVVALPEDRPRAERWLLDGLVKDSEGFMSRHVERRISLAISRRLAGTPVTPNAMTLVSIGVGLAGAALFLSARTALQFAGALLFLAHSILDGCDGELARLKFQESRLGGVLDFWGDNLVHGAVFAAIAFSWARASGKAAPLVLGGLAVAGTLGSALFVYLHTMRAPAATTESPVFTTVSRSSESRLSRIADFLARRDFIYLVVILAAFGQSRWFLLLASIGAPLFFLVLLTVAWTGHRAPALSESAR